MKFFPIWLILIGYLKATPWNNLTANIAVVEFQPIRDPSLSTNERILQNTKKYVEIVTDTNSVSKLDLIIFPEASLRNNPETAVEIQIKSNPCSSVTYPQFLSDLSCTARKFRTYLVVNLVEKSKCDDNQNCKNDSFYFYNTDVIFDRKGIIICKYRKYNLFGEYELDKPTISENVTFDTDFGIKFGVFTCFDIMFKNPAEDLLEKDVDGIIFPSMWYSELPFLTALQAQQMWAYAHDVTFFGAGANTPSAGSGGSGIYAGSRGTVSEGIVADGDSRLFLYESKNGEISPPPHEDIDVLGKEMDSFKLYTDNSLREFNSTVLNISATNLQKELCHGNQKDRLCCNFDVTVSTQELNRDLHSYTYHIVAFSGIRSFMSVYNGGIELCAVVACLNDSLSSCGHRFSNYEDIRWPIVFEKISIRANFENHENKTQFPNSLLSSIRPINASETIWTRRKKDNEEKVVEVTFALRKPQNRLLTFGIYGRNFGNDSPPERNTSSSGAVTWFLLICVIVLSTVTIT